MTILVWICTSPILFTKAEGSSELTIIQEQSSMQLSINWKEGTTAVIAALIWHLHSNLQIQGGFQWVRAGSTCLITHASLAGWSVVAKFSESQHSWMPPNGPKTNCYACCDSIWSDPGGYVESDGQGFRRGLRVLSGRVGGGLSLARLSRCLFWVATGGLNLSKLIQTWWVSGNTQRLHTYSCAGGG